MIGDDYEFMEAWLGWGRKPNVASYLDGLVAGDTVEILCWPEIPPLNAGSTRTISKAWLSVKDKQSDADPTENAAWSPTAGARQSISTTEVAGRGVILSASETTPELRFDVTAANTALMTARKTYYFDVQVLMSDGALYTVERGTFTLAKGVTAATS